MGKGKRSIHRAIAAQNKKCRAEHALTQLGRIAESMIRYPTATHDFQALKDVMTTLYRNVDLSGAPKDIRESFNSIYNTTSHILDMAKSEDIKEEPSILDRPLRGSLPK